MEYRKIKQAEAVQISQWKYPPPYDFYDITADEEDYQEFIDPRKRSEHTYSVFERGVIIGFLTAIPVDEGKVEIGLGMRPDLTGKGRGEEQLSSMLEFVKKEYDPHTVTLAVAKFNRRAITVYERAGFKKIETYPQKTNGGVYPFIRMNMHF
ncbi:GNAT family N-acetyltransferase [Halobacillus salinarum]|uniref:GNAT family N-acetyltransferase n=1 Tax=Halobacillus salinarum TaxID=2932257 RepID=A0ABY4ELC5_9BACI|nr:GNAT family N-acetyltransferase [Halobacillus salinarum]UOQ45261.1 GNAT family N-acetyltransferase [Halobacillus salinarum]